MSGVAVRGMRRTTTDLLHVLLELDDAVEEDAIDDEHSVDDDDERMNVVGGQGASKSNRDF